MKRIAKTVLACGCFASVILAGSENFDGSCDLPWTLTFICLAYICARGYRKLEKAK